MGIIPLVLITVIIAIFVLIKIPNLTLTRKVIIAAAILMLFFIGVAYIFITGFESGGRPNLEETPIIQKE
ncbi:hypothetical protein OMO38_16725 [Chryseobacterium sp. 09-1422]|uniref:Uncharacterized protein n=1 Tax=Chryseobacterium kimseyorum TaxID=2984028 RepID=A0ABT3I2B8_9FLAO|nr:hypothetical protein [Chryseobacterium kimseyorum]MCW3170173.1 hypothetical protein [Chryseobacterium kimseyorum]